MCLILQAMIRPVIKAKCQNKASKAFAMTTECLSPTERGKLSAEDYIVLSDRIFRVKGAVPLLQNSGCADLQKRCWVLPVPALIQVVAEAELES